MMEPGSMKYLIKARFVTDGVVERPDVVGAIFGQTEGLLGEDMDLRDLQKSGRIGRIEVEIETKMGRSEGKIYVPSSLDQVETAIVAAALETIDRIGPCKAKVTVEGIEDIRATKRQRIVERAKELLEDLLKQGREVSENLLKAVIEKVHLDEIMSYGEERLPAGPAIDNSDAIIVVEGRNDVLNLMRYGIKNVIALNGTSVPKTIIELSKKKVVTAFVDGDHAGDLIIKELLQVADIDYIARAPPGTEVEELTYKQIIKALRDKIPAENYKELMAERESYESKGERDNGTKDIMQKCLENRVAYLFNREGNIVEEVQISQLIDKLQEYEEGKISKIVMGGVVSQRLVDVAFSKGITEIHAVKKGNITKKPTNMRIVIHE